MKMEDFEKAVAKNIKRNKKYIKEFENKLKEKGLSKKTIRNHLNNIDLFLNNYLNYYDIILMEDGIGRVYSFLGDFFIRKCLWSSKTSIKSNAATLKKFYKCMSEKKYIEKEIYEQMVKIINDNMDFFLDELDAYDNYGEEDYFGF
ncbi:MAG: site-specific integrase [Bacilli bacterium]|nr:site-specific integrase [Bacilli bacterium]